MVTKFIKLFFVLFLISACSAVKMLPEQIEGTFLQKENKNIQLRFDQNSFLFIDTYQQTHMPPYECCDTIAYGYWELENDGLIKLFSDPKLYLPVDLQVEESMTNYDSVYFDISSPIEGYNEGNSGKNKKGIVYHLYIDSDVQKLEYETLRYFDSNRIVLANPNNGKVQKFSIGIYPTYSFRGRNIGAREVLTKEYEVKDPTSNVFEVSVPGFNYGYLTYKRLDGDYVKVINKNRLLWDGQEYIKSD